jgi:hypothetical protein
MLGGGGLYDVECGESTSQAKDAVGFPSEIQRSTGLFLRLYEQGLGDLRG